RSPELEDLPAVTARQYVEDPALSEAFVRGTVTPEGDRFVWIHTSDGNVMAGLAPGTPHEWADGDSVIVLLKRQESGLRHEIGFVQKIGTSTPLADLPVVSAAHDLWQTQRHPKIVLGNLLASTSRPVAGGCRTLLQRGSPRRSVKICSA